MHAACRCTSPVLLLSSLIAMQAAMAGASGSATPAGPGMPPAERGAAVHDAAGSIPLLPLLSGTPEVRSSAVVIADASDSSILYARHAGRIAPIASITKLMTALVVLEGGQLLEEPIEITAEDCRLEKPVASRLRIGMSLSRDDMLRLALMSSENRAAQALARSYPGGLGAFVRAMNDKAHALGMRTARFADPTGLSSGNVSSAEDLVRLVRAAAGHPRIREYSTYPSHVVDLGRQRAEFRNTNTLVDKAEWDIQVQKTGYTLDAGQCLVMQATILDRPIVMILLNSFGKYTRVADARRIRRWMETGSSARAAAVAPR